MKKQSLECHKYLPRYFYQLIKIEAVVNFFVYCRDAQLKTMLSVNYFDIKEFLIFI